MSTSDPLGVFGPQIRVERHLRTWGHLPDHECGDTGEFGELCEMPGAQPVENPEPSRIEYQPTSPLAENRQEQYRQKYIGSRAARRERFNTAEKSRVKKDALRKKRKLERKNRRRK